MGVLFGYSALAVFLFKVIMYAIAQVKKDNSIVDIGWGVGFVVVALVSLFAVPGYTERQLLVTILVIVWGLRLAFHIYWRGRGKGEDFRYVAMRKKWGKNAAITSFYRVFMLQGAIMLIIAYPIMYVNRDPQTGFQLLDWLGVLVWVVGFLFEAVGDYQLLRFLKHRKKPGEIMTTGLWKYTRHPNYFGEALLWWGIYLIVLSAQGGWWMFVSPLAMTFLLLKVSGVPLLERKYANNPAYLAYMRRTNRFVPWFPKA